jgi:hypothetical protein
MLATPGLPRERTEVRLIYIAAIAGLAGAFIIGQALPITMQAVSAAMSG